MPEMTNIYGLFDPRDPRRIMYVGKGKAQRAAQHWKDFTRIGQAGNVLLRRWFEGLKADGVEPAWRFLEENVVDWCEAEKFWIRLERVRNTALCNVAKGGNSWPLDSVETHEIKSRIGRANVESGHLRKISVLGGKITGRKMAKKPGHMSNIGRIGGRIGGLKGGRTNVESGHLRKISSLGGRARIKLHGCPLTYKDRQRGSCTANHNRWHVNRGLLNPNCKLCQEGQK